MDPTLPQMQSFDFDRLDPIALEDTLAYLRQHPDPPPEDVALFGSYQGLLDDAVAERDWTAGPLQDMGQSRLLNSLQSSPSVSCDTSTLGGFPQCRRYVLPGQMATEEFITLPQSLEPGGSPTTAPSWSNCTWDGYQQRLHGRELTAHLESHSHKALTQWKKGSKCTWQGCKTKAVFKIPRLLKEHLKNIHTQPLLCPRRGCLYKKPFGKEGDLHRHIYTKHHNQHNWECPYVSCPSETRTFARRDKWLKHIRETQHENDAYCPSYHCKIEAVQSGKKFENRMQIVKHIKENHPRRCDNSYQCALGSCGKARHGDRWNVWHLYRHLRDQHRIKEVHHAEMDSLPERTFSLQHVPSPDLNGWIDCDICASQVQAPLNIPTLPGATLGAAPLSSPAFEAPSTALA